MKISCRMNVLFALAPQFIALLLMAFASPRVGAQGFTFATLAGSAGISARVDGTRNAARFVSPIAVGVDPSGNIYVSDGSGNNIRKVTPAGVVTTWVGSNQGTAGSADGNGTSALFNSPNGLSFDSAGNGYVADTGNYVIRKITPAGVVTLLAGSVGNIGSVDGTGSAAVFIEPTGTVVDDSGNVYVADFTEIRKITPAGVVTSFVGARYSSGSADGTGAAAQFYACAGIARDSGGNLYVTEWGNNTIRKITPAGVVTTLAGSPGFTGSADGTGSSARFNRPSGIAVDGAGNVFVADTLNQTIRRITPAGVVTTIGGMAGQSGSADGIGGSARFYGPSGLAINSAGYLYVGDAFNNFLLRVGAPAGADSLPIITAQPLDQTNMVGQNAVFTLTVIGTPTPVYQWQRSTNGGTTWTDLANDATYGGTTTATLTVTHVALVMQGDKFQCLATNSVGSTASNAVALKVSPAYLFTTLAGSAGQVGSADGIGTAARFNMPNGLPSGVAVDTEGNVFVADMSNHIIRKITPGGVVTTFAGSAGLSGSTDGVGNNARFSNPAGLAFDSVGNLFVADFGNNAIRKITPDGTVSTFVGLAGSFGDVDGIGSAARFYGPSGIAIDQFGDFFVADNYNNKIKKITPDGQVSTIAGGADTYQFSDEDGGGTGMNAKLTSPVSIAVDRAQNLYVVELGIIRKINSKGEVTTLAGNGNGGTTDGPGSAARFVFPFGIAVDAAGTVYVTDSYNRTIRMITQSGMVSTLAGTVGVAGTADGIGTNAQFAQPMGIAVDSSGHLYVTDAGSQTIRVGTFAGVTTGPSLSEQPASETVVAGHRATFSVAATALPVPDYQWQVSANNGVSWTNLIDDATFAGADTAGLTVLAQSLGLSGCLFRCVVSNSQGRSNSNIATLTVDAPVGSFAVTTWAGKCGYFGTVDGSVTDARFHAPTGMAFNQAGVLYLADTENGTIRKITAQGVVSTFAGMPGASGATDGAGSAAQFYKPRGLATDGAGNVYVADSYNHTVRKITPGGVVSTLAGLAQQSGGDDGIGASARFMYPTDLAIDVSGNLYVADQGNDLIRKVTPAGVVTTIAGTRWQTGVVDGTGNAARFTNPGNIAIDSSGNLFVSENSTIRRITSSGVVTTFAGKADAYGSTDGNGVNAAFDMPAGLDFDLAGNLYVVDSGTHLLRRISPAGDVVTLAGSSFQFGPDDGTGNSAKFNHPAGLAVDSSGTVYIADTGNHAIRKAILPSPMAPSIASQPASSTAMSGNSVTFIVTAGGTPTPTFQWQKNGVNISGATGNTYKIGPVAESDAGSYRVVVTNSVGTVISSGAVLTVVAAPDASSQVLGDFDGNGTADLVWTNTQTGERSMWFLNGNTTSGGASLGVVPVEWVVSATADFDGDGKADIFWTNTITGDRAMWLMNGSAMRTNTFMGTVPTDWVISGTGDFNGDGKADLVWTNTTTGDRAMWLMNGSTVLGGGYLGTVPVEWNISGVGDFNGDGKADLIWSNTVTGERSMWFQDGSTTIGGSTLNTVPVVWAISGVGDFNGDGKADVFLTNTVTGDRVIWLMNGSTITTNAFMGTVPVEWTVSGTGDFNDDGKKDLFWTNTVIGDRAMWLINGATVTGGGFMGTVPTVWKINH
ncbi:MAG: immunoglobulin domain-containing protein [Lacunisphaera sp.]